MHVSQSGKHACVQVASSKVVWECYWLGVVPGPRTSRPQVSVLQRTAHNHMPHPSPVGLKIAAVCATIFQALAVLGLVAFDIPYEIEGLGSVDGDGADMTFGSDSSDAHMPALIAFLCSIVALILAIVIIVMTCMAKWLQSSKLAGVAMLFNVIYYIYMIPWELEVFGVSLDVNPGYGLGAGMCTAAFFNFVYILVFAKKLGASTSTGASV